MTAKPAPAPQPTPHRITDPRALGALAHPLRMRILQELSVHDAVRAADLATSLQQPANSISFHLRQLARYGLIEPDEERATNKRDRWWRLPSDQGYQLDFEELAGEEGGPVALDAFRSWAQNNSHALVAAALATTKSDDAEALIADAALRLSRAEAEQFARELQELHQRWSARSREQSPESDPQGRRTYYAVTYLAAADLVYRQLTGEAPE